MLGNIGVALVGIDVAGVSNAVTSIGCPVTIMSGPVTSGRGLCLRCAHMLGQGPFFGHETRPPSCLPTPPSVCSAATLGQTDTAHQSIRERGCLRPECGPVRLGPSQSPVTSWSARWTTADHTPAPRGTSARDPWTSCWPPFRARGSKEESPTATVLPSRSKAVRSAAHTARPSKPTTPPGAGKASFAAVGIGYFLNGGSSWLGQAGVRRPAGCSVTGCPLLVSCRV